MTSRANAITQLTAARSQVKALKDEIIYIKHENNTNIELHVDIMASKKREATKQLDALYNEWQDSYKTDLTLSLHYKDEAAQATIKVLERKEQEDISILAAKIEKRFLRLKKEEMERRERYFHDCHKRLVSDIREEVEKANSVRLNEAIVAHKEALRNL